MHREITQTFFIHLHKDVIFIYIYCISGIMRTDNLSLLFKNFSLHTDDVQSYIINLLSKFEVALLWDQKHLLIPSLLPDEDMIMNSFSRQSAQVSIC